MALFDHFMTTLTKIQRLTTLADRSHYPAKVKLETPMSQFDVQSLENNFNKWRQERTPEEKESDAFEVYSIEQILKHDDLTDEEIESGRVGGGDDGGVDGMYIFINRRLIQDESQIPDNALSFDLVIIQSKYSKSFTEPPIEKFHLFSNECFDWGRNPDDIQYFNASVKAAIKRFREAADMIAETFHVGRVLVVTARCPICGWATDTSNSQDHSADLGKVVADRVNDHVSRSHPNVSLGKK